MNIKKLVIAGAGTMGYSIAEIFAEYDFEVTLYDVNEDALLKAKENIKLNMQTTVSEKGWSEEQVEDFLKNISYTSSMDCFKHTDLVIECIVEKLDVKKVFYSKISKIVEDDTILATNTSGLSINALAEAIIKPERFIGMHWFNPSHLVLLIEIIKGDMTNDETAQTINNLCLKVNKKPVIVNKDVPGFVANRIQFAILREALYLVENGVVDGKGIDDIMKYGLGFRYACAGPLEVADFGGLDTFYHISDYLMQDLCAETQVPPLLDKLYSQGHLGVKSKKGFYDYSNGKDEEAVINRDEKLVAIFNALYGSQNK